MAPTRRALLTLLKTADLSVVTSGFIVAVGATGGALDVGGWLRLLELRISLANALFMAAYLGLWHLVLRGRGLYLSYRLSAASRELRDLGIAVMLATAPLLPFALLFRFGLVTIPFILVFSTVTFIGLGIERRFLRVVGRRLRHYGRNLRNVIIVGTADSALDLASKLARQEDLGYRVAKIIGADDPGSADNGTALLTRVETLIEQLPIDEIFIALPLDTSHTLIRNLISISEEQGITVRVIAHVTSPYWAQAVMDIVGGQPVLTMYTGRANASGLVVKRAIDLVGATVGLVFLAPLFFVAAAAIKLGSRGRVFFAQERVGFNRRRFRAYKFRTMVDGAEAMQSDLEPLNEADGPVFKIENDPRVTRVGKLLRRVSIDELPQLFNVLRGEMSLVGPRPLPLRDVSRIDVRWHKRRFSVKPGITCLWQVNNRQPKFDDWVRSDMEYIDNWSLALDLKILARTLPAIVSGQGAH